MKHVICPFILSLLVLLTYSCSKDEVKPDDSDKDLTINKKMNKFIASQMKDVYLWADQVKDRDINLNMEPEEFLEKMKYQAEDKWSFLEKEETETKSLVEGTEFSHGYEVMFYKDRVDDIIGIICFVYPNSPAAEAGLKRGDIILKNNDEWLTINNYQTVYTDATVKLKIGIFNGDKIDVIEKTYEVSRRQVDIQPILLDTILQVQEKKIGYLAYSEFIDNKKNSLNDLNNVFSRFKQAQPDEFVLDLRYNPGGISSATQRLASLLAPTQTVANEEVIMNYKWNDTYQEQFKNYKDRIQLCFDSKALPYNLNLSRIYILTSSQTASASEALISGLKPYIPNITLIGKTTVGKYVGMSQAISKDEELKKWTLWPITYYFTNKEGESVRGGLEPHYEAEEDFLVPLGDYERDPLLSIAVDLITGVKPTATLPSRSAIKPHLTPLKSTPKRQGFYLLK